MNKLEFDDVFATLDQQTVPTVQSDSLMPGIAMDGNSGAPEHASADAFTRESRRLSIGRCIGSLVHASDCRDADCVLPSCYKMKRVIHHAKGCKKMCARQPVSGDQSQQTTDECLVCKQLIALCCYHAKTCRHNKCPVAYCAHIKNKLRAQQIQQRLREALMLKRRIASMASMCQHSSQQQQQTSTTPATTSLQASAQIEAVVALVNNLNLRQ